MGADLYFHGERRPAEVWEDRSKRAATGLIAAKLGNGAKIGILLPNCFDFIESYIAVGLAGSIPIPLSTHMSEADYRALAGRESLDAVITSCHGSTRWAQTHPLRQFIVGTSISAVERWEDLLPTALQANEAGLSVAPYQMFFTSGSTGIPKTVLRGSMPHELSELRSKRFQRSWRMVPGMRSVITGPLYHQAPLFYAMGAIRCAERVVILDTFDPASVLAAITEHQISHCHMVPRLMARLAGLPKGVRLHHDCSSLRFALHGAAPCDRQVKYELIKWWGPLFSEYYATSEFGMVCQIETDEWLARPTSVGRPFEGVEIQIRDLRDEEPLPPGRLGRIFMRSDDMPDYYYRQSEGQSTVETEVRRRGEWISVDDLGYLDEDGFLHVTGRADGLANISGVKFHSQVVNLALGKLPYVDEAVVEVVADSERGDAFRAAIRLKREAANTPAERIREDLRPWLPSLAIPKTIAIVEDELPVLDTGKTITRYLQLEGARIDTSPIAVVTSVSQREPPPPRFPTGVDVIAKIETGSTNEDAVALASDVTAPLTLVWAERQWAGRGRSDRRWVSEPGNVFWTMLVDTSSDPPHSFGLVFVTALAVLSTVRAFTPGNCRVKTKWPNDTLIDGRKVSGVLINSVAGRNGPMRAVGVGINVTSFPTIGMMYPATCLRAEGSAAHRNEVLTLLTATFLGYLERWRNSGFGEIRAEYLDHAYRLGETVSIRTDADQYVTGVFRDVTEAGIKLIMPTGECKTISAGDLVMGRN